MSLVRIVVNDKVLFDGELNQWVERPPEFVAEMAHMLQPGAVQRPQAHMLALMAVFGEAMARQADIDIQVSTGIGWWSMHVKEN